MIKKLTNADLDNIIEFWKYEAKQLNNNFKNRDLVSEYTVVKEKFLENMQATSIYTEDDSINGFISVDKENNIWDIIVKSTIRREGIGTVLLENCKKTYNKLTAVVPTKNKIAVQFFEANDFQIVDKTDNKLEEINEDVYRLQWEKKEKKHVKLIYFNDDINKDFLNDSLNFDYQAIDVNKFIENDQKQTQEISNITAYMGFRKELEKAMNCENIFLYIDYNNYHMQLDEQIKDYAKIKKINLTVLTCEPFSIESTKKDSIIQEITKSYGDDFKVQVVDCSLDKLEEDVSINQIFNKRNELLVKKIQELAQNV